MLLTFLAGFVNTGILAVFIALGALATMGGGIAFDIDRHPWAVIAGTIIGALFWTTAIIGALVRWGKEF